MKFKKRYFFGLAFIAFVVFLHSGFFAMRTSAESLKTALMAQGQLTPLFATYEYKGQPIHYLQIGNEEDKPVIIFVHGSPGSLDNFQDYYGDTTLSQLANMVAVDRPGFGYSGFGKAEVELEKQAAAMKPLLEKFKTQRVILVGHSLGGPMIARMAMDFPDLVDGLVMVAPSVDPDLEGSSWWRKVLDLPLINLLAPSALRACNREIIYLKEELSKMIPLWPKVTVPVTVIQGSEDKLVPAGNAIFVQRMLTNSSRVKVELLEGEGHFILWSKSEIVKTAIRDLVLMLR